MNPSNKKSPPPADFQYAEFYDDIICPFCNALIFRKSPEKMMEMDADELTEYLDGSGDPCVHVGFWSDGRISEPNVSENWRKEMRFLTQAIKDKQYDDDDDWPEQFNFAIWKEGNIGWPVALVLPIFQVAVFRQFTRIAEGPRLDNHVVVFMREKCITTL